MESLHKLNPQERHNYILEHFVLNNEKSNSRRLKRDIDVIRENHKFLWDDDEVPESWESRLAKKYYDKLFKEYCIADLSRFKENKVALRWRTEQEVVSGRGQFTCGNRICGTKEQLRSWEVNFAYMESGEKKNALIKLRLCPDCSQMLNYRSQKREVKRQKHREKEENLIKKSGKRMKKEKNSIEGNYNINKEVSETKVGCRSTTSPGEMNLLKSSGAVKETEESMNVWKNRVAEVEIVEREEEFEKYLEDLLM